MPIGKKRTLREKWRLTSLSNKTVTLATVVIAAAALNLVVAMFQMNSAGKQTDRIIAADERLATAMEGEVGQAGASLSATQNAFRDDQRAWLGPVSGTTTLDVNHTVRVDVIFQNIGKTPALDVSTILDWKDIPSGPIRIEYSRLAKSMGQGTLYPNGKEGMFAASPQKPTEEQLEAYRAGKRVFYFFGSIDYKDVFGRQHRSHLCNILNSDLATVRQCDVYNDAN